MTTWASSHISPFVLFVLDRDRNLQRLERPEHFVSDDQISGPDDERLGLDDDLQVRRQQLTFDDDVQTRRDVLIGDARNDSVKLIAMDDNAWTRRP